MSLQSRFVDVANTVTVKGLVRTTTAAQGPAQLALMHSVTRVDSGVYPTRIEPRAEQVTTYTRPDDWPDCGFCGCPGSACGKNVDADMAEERIGVSVAFIPSLMQVCDGPGLSRCYSLLAPGLFANEKGHEQAADTFSIPTASTTLTSYTLANAIDPALPAMMTTNPQVPTTLVTYGMSPSTLNSKLDEDEAQQVRLPTPFPETSSTSHLSEGHEKLSVSTNM